jgi:hypothetical protein
VTGKEEKRQGKKLPTSKVNSVFFATETIPTAKH